MFDIIKKLYVSRDVSIESRVTCFRDVRWNAPLNYENSTETSR